MKYLSLSTILLLCSFQVIAQDIVAGPMLGYNTMREVAVWVQVDKESSLQLRYWPKGSYPVIAKLSQAVETSDRKTNTALLIAELLEPGTSYQYEIFANGKTLSVEGPLTFTTQSLWHWRENPPAFNFLAGSCMYINDPAYDRPGKPYGGQYEILKKMANEEADFMMWLGDNIYLREADWNSRSGIYYRNKHTRQIPELQPLLRSMHHYAIWDDHDYGPNDSDGTYWNKHITLEAFKDFWANPNYGVAGLGGVTGVFTWNDCQYFLLDNRWHREAQDPDNDLLGKEQIDWLINSLRGSKASFKFICVGGQLLSDFQKYENHAIFVKERAYIIRQLDKYNIKGVIILNGDRHSSEISKHTTADGDVFYDVTSSPLTSGSYDHTDEDNSKRIPGTMVGEQSYAQFFIEGTFKQRSCRVELKDKNGKILVQQKLEF